MFFSIQNSELSPFHLIKNNKGIPQSVAHSHIKKYLQNQTFRKRRWKARCGGVTFYPNNSGGRGRRVSLSSRPTWSTKKVPRQPGIHRRSLSRKTNKSRKRHSKYPLISKSTKFTKTLPRALWPSHYSLSSPLLS